MLSVDPIAAPELLARLQQVPLTDGVRRPYAAASLALETLDPSALAPVQNYVLRDGVERALALRAALAAAHAAVASASLCLDLASFDPFALDGALWLTTLDGRVPLLPPVVEESLEPDGTVALLVADGQHRVWAARSLGVPVSAVVVRGVDPAMPYYAFPLATGWDGVEVLDALPPGRAKKAYRQPEGYKALFRDYNAVFPGVQEQRARTNPAHLQA